MSRLLLQWILSAVALLVVSAMVRGFWVEGFFAALAAAFILGLLNATLGLLLKIITFPISLLTLGLFLFVINAAMILLTAKFVSGFHVHGFVPALIGAVVLSLLNLLFRPLVKER
jgi:putative membrane protein